MTIRKGEPWGVLQPVPSDLTVVADDRALGEHLSRLRAAGSDLGVVGVRGGDLARTLGGGTPGRLVHDGVRATVDLLRVCVDGEHRWAAAHVVCGQWWFGEAAIFMNAQFRGSLDLAPRSHPNDGRVDLLHMQPSMTLQQRWQAHRRARSGTHVPHPHLTSASRASFHLDFVRPLWVYLDGARWKRTRMIEVDVESDAYHLFA